VPDADFPVKYALGPNLSTSQVPGRSGIDVATALAFEMAAVDVAPTPRNTVTVLSLTIRYCPGLMPDVLLAGDCTPVGGVGVAAVNDTVAPSGVNGKTNVDMVAPS
tara:strand:- start:142 stop:459 length:318 start_codon:yes stop_codon:yes gene_type:complete